MAEDDTNGVVHALDRDGRGARHAEQIVVRVIRPTVNTIAQRLAGILILEFQICASERHPTHDECRIHRHVQ